MLSINTVCVMDALEWLAEGRGYAGCDINVDFVAETKKSLTTNK